MELLVCMSIAGSIPVVICLLLYIIQRGNYNYILGRRLLLTGVFFYLVPVQLVKYLLPKDALPETMLIGKKADSYLSGSLAFWSEKQGDYIWIPQWFNIFARPESDSIKAATVDKPRFHANYSLTESICVVNIPNCR